MACLSAISDPSAKLGRVCGAAPPLFHGLLLGRTGGAEPAFPELELRLVGDAADAALRQMHHLLVLGVEARPLRLSARIGIAAAREIDPIAGDAVGELPVLPRPFPGPEVEMVEEIEDLGRVI